MANVIDVSEHNGWIDWEAINAAGYHAIIRCGYGNDQEDQDDEQFERNISECERLGIPHGVYIYSYATDTDMARSEAAHVLRLLNGRMLQYPVYFDTEESGTERCSYDCAVAFGEVIEAAGYWCGVYAGAYWWINNLAGLDRFTKWVAHWGVDSPAVSCDLWQYTSDGWVDGISHRTDMNVSFREFPENGPNVSGVVSEPVVTCEAIDCADVAATLHAHLCEHNWHGYDWEDRWGDGEGVCPIEIGGRTYEVQQGDRDCSSSEIECWRQALRYTPYEGLLDAAIYTGNMREVFVNSGLFDWMPMSFIAQRGDIYLNEANHTAMCQMPSPDTLSEFCHNEFGGCYGGQVGDQTGTESRIAPYYNFPWDGILHYNGKADTTVKPVVETLSIDLESLADAVMAGAYGNGEERRTKLGANYEAVQSIVNARCNSVDLYALADAVIRGEYGNGNERRERLGANYDAVQAIVNGTLG